MRPNLNAVILSILDYIGDINQPVEVYINLYTDGSWCVSDQRDYGGSSTSLMVGSRTPKLLRKDVKTALDILESSGNDRRRGNSTKRVPRLNEE